MEPRPFAEPKSLEVTVPFNWVAKKYFVGKDAKYRDHATYFMSVLYSYTIKRVSMKETANRFVPMNKRWMINTLGLKATQVVLDTLLNHNVIEIDDHFCPGAKSKGYRITRPITNAYNVKQVSINHTKLKRKILKSERDKWMTNYQGWTPVESWLHDNLLETHIDSAGALAEIAEGKDQYQIASQIACVRQLESKWKIQGKTGDTGRMYTTFSQLKKVARPFVTHKGRQLIEHDIRCCQPVMLLVVAAGRRAGRFFEDVNRLNRCNKAGFLDVFYKQSDRMSIPAYEMQDYSGLIYNEDIYEWIKNEAWDKHRRLYTRDEVKREVMRDIFAKEKGYYSVVEEVFKHRFPNLYNGIASINAGSYKHLIRSLQWLESEIVLHGVSEALRQQGADGVLTIHDCISAPAEYSDMIMEGFNEVSEKLTIPIPCVIDKTTEEMQAARERAFERQREVAEISRQNSYIQKHLQKT